MYSVSFAKHTLECSVIVFGVHGKTFVGVERRRVEELCAGLDSSLFDVVGVGLITCAEVGLVRQVHTLFVRSAQQVVHELQVQEGVRQEVREVNGESKVKEHKTHDLSHGECARCDDVLTNEKKHDKAHSHSGVRVDVLNVEVSGNSHVVIGVRIVQCYHAIITNSEFSFSVQLSTWLSGCMI